MHSESTEVERQGIKEAQEAAYTHCDSAVVVVVCKTSLQVQLQWQQSVRSSLVETSKALAVDISHVRDRLLLAGLAEQVGHSVVPTVLLNALSTHISSLSPTLLFCCHWLLHVCVSTLCSF